MYCICILTLFSLKVSINKIVTRRSFVLGGVLFFAQCSLLGRLYYLQIVKNHKYTLLSDKNRIRTMVLYPLRGKIIDCNGKILASNKKCYKLLCENINIQDKQKLIDRLISIIYLSNEEIEFLTANLYSKQKLFFIKNDISWDEILKIESNIFELSGIYIELYHKRHYIYGSTMSHFIGYIRNTYTDQKYNILGLKTLDSNGFIGVESIFDQTLKGEKGVAYYEVNAIGKPIRVLDRVNDIEGKEIQVTLDADLHKAIFDITSDLYGYKGLSICVMDVNTGEIRAMFNRPAYDNNIFSDNFSNQIWNELVNHPDKLMINRCIAMQIPPGSSFKLITTICGLETEIFSVNSSAYCTGVVEILGKERHCWKDQGGHKKIENLEMAVASSCNVFFYNSAKSMNIESISRYATLFGLGANEPYTQFSDEKLGVIPNAKWCKKNGIPWYLGDTINVSIGQGYVLVTPLQLCIMASRFATKTSVTPTITPRDKTKEKKKLFQLIQLKNKSNLDFVRECMFSVMNKPFGTAYRHRLDKDFLAGKTGTAQMVSGYNKYNRYHYSFAGFFPFEDPKYAISTVFESTLVDVGNSAAKVSAQVAHYLKVRDQL